MGDVIECDSAVDVEIGRRPHCIADAERHLAERLWYDRHQLELALIELGRMEPPPVEIAECAAELASRIRDEHGIEHLGPYSDLALGMLLGKLSAIRWVLGGESDILDS